MLLNDLLCQLTLYTISLYIVCISFMTIVYVIISRLVPATWLRKTSRRRRDRSIPIFNIEQRNMATGQPHTPGTLNKISFSVLADFAHASPGGNSPLLRREVIRPCFAGRNLQLILALSGGIYNSPLQFAGKNLQLGLVLSRVISNSPLLRREIIRPCFAGR